MGLLKGIPRILSPDLLYTLSSMGHGDEIVLADANFPASSCSSQVEFGKFSEYFIQISLLAFFFTTHFSQFWYITKSHL